MRMTGSYIKSMDVAGVLIDGGTGIHLDGNLIQENGGVGIILSAGEWGCTDRASHPRPLLPLILGS